MAMFFSVPVSGSADLDTIGCPVEIDGRVTTLRRTAGYLDYVDVEGETKHCKILTEGVSGNLLSFFAASHGDEDAAYATITTDGKVTRFRVTRFGVTPLGDSPVESAPQDDCE